MNEPRQLVRGKAFHARVQEEWLTDTFGAAVSERNTVEVEHLNVFRQGRMDVRMIDPDEPMAFVVEIKDSDFDSMTAIRIRRNVARHRLQVSRYGETLLNIPDNKIEFVCLAIVYSTEPKEMSQRDSIERYLGEYMVSTYWHNTQRGAPLF